ncbi:hypothetical protein DFH07DRAFT_977003 [Mycena maculata]|uniref:BTB domain-containing protein n=1 Tax=Mycena maculata TaxID=230809 RepID=A0AAD7N547_9AGAR|nr:hypothetical protein DFH07DRAFT_977003 [Mycena maculata]
MDNFVFGDMGDALGTLTPPNSHAVTPIPEAEDIVSVSATFHPAAGLGLLPPDVILLSQDGVRFYVNSTVLLLASENAFRAMLPVFLPVGNELPVLHIPESSPVLNVILHAIYNIPCAHYSPSFSTLVNVVESMPTYGINPKLTILPPTHLFTLLLAQAPFFPLQLYALAARHDVFDLAVPTSSHLLSFPLWRLSDEMSERMGAIYLKRLFFLHIGRAEAFKRIIGPPPDHHSPSTPCNFDSQNELGRAWAQAIARLVWDARPDMSTHSIEIALRPLAEDLTCDLCRDALGVRIGTLISQWSAVKRTI